ncbi:efflux transporter periplasmic adaptor subunit [Bacillus thuringiensis serovar roskildiensis]|uniref:Efflux transporter periplasmic adaptor subunit n=1 Tax=Bacillus thuringiensis serovar sooncheon TaxID=180891 RepID=A0A9Q5SKB8_BACTU|nr:biotin/lipoyl-binding protein [Bacillus thuringiensis]MEB9661050.1 HlyD family efflux transporter periplasmic adaptor subunit [Bacillus cereus]ARV91341.1 efflux transporter periplasmic adaptor subunit [Bacillus thuringiensis]OTW70675.1 efflux transporter periplasmic adaptor subunit [Bacillus thuringiensis serovar coreanensis]OTX50986.1 efflux transporter periplasmic adaptor subunit [Bacillus thuringiensis serovar sooncheon]OTX56841.1 efflux transporter periplasmic adaptor subunit [Bacillus 
MLSSNVPGSAKKKRRIIIGVITLFSIIIAINIFLIQGQKKENKKVDAVSLEKVTERKLNNTKLISGQVKPGNIESFYADPTKGKVKDIAVKEGQEVEKGTKLFSYDNEEINLQMKQAELDQKMADMRYNQGKKKIDSLKKEIKKAKDGGAGKEVTDPMEEQVSELEMAQKTTDLEKEKGKLQKEELSKKQKDLTIYSNFAGVVQKLDKDAVQSSSQALGGQGKAFLQVASKDPFQVQGTLTELQKSQIQKDQTFTVTAKANNKKKWTGKITEVSEFPTSAEMAQGAGLGEATQNMSQYTYKASLDSQDGLSPGYHVSLQVNLENKTMIAVPTKSIVEKGEDAFVYIEEKGKLRKQHVKKGATDGDWTEIVEGATVGQKVVKNPSDNVYDGMEVKEK